MPTPTPGPLYDPVVNFDDLSSKVVILRQEMPEWEQQIRELPWIADGILYSEHRAARGLVYLAVYGGDYFPKFMEHPWVVEGRNKPAMETIGDLARYYPEDFQKVVNHPTIRDGITDEKAVILPTLHKAAAYHPGLIETLLDPEQVTLEERTIDLPLAGRVQLVIIRTQPGLARTMDLLETAVRSIEGFMSVPLPRQQVIYLVNDALLPKEIKGANFTDLRYSPPRYDSDNLDLHQIIYRLTHESGHYYWSSSDAEFWISEGAPSLLGVLQANASTGWPIRPHKNRGCPSFKSIAELESLDPPIVRVPEFSCRYEPDDLGERMFLDLYHVLGDTAVSEGFRRLYIDDTGDDCEDDDKVGICHVEVAFKAGASEEAAEKVDQVIACWYHGDKAACPDTSPTDPLAPVLGPAKGFIPHRPGGIREEQFAEFEQSGDVMIEVTFENPYPLNESHWIYGLDFSNFTGDFRRIYLSSRKTWRHSYKSAEKEQPGGGRWQEAPGLDVSEGGENHLRLIKIGDTGWFYVNDRFIAKINFSLGNLPNTDQIRLVVEDDGKDLNYKDLNYKEGDATRYRDYTIWKWRPPRLG